MFLKKVKLRNFCQHISRTVEFQKGLNVIVGPNGSGKSNILNAVYGALTGDFGRNAGKAAENISLNTDGGECSVDLHFSHNSQDLRLLRRLEPVDRQLFVNDKIYTSDKEVSEKLLHILEVDKEILGQYVFVEQWDNFGPLALSAAKRISAFQKLFKIEQLNKIGDNLSDGSLKLSTVGIASQNLQELNDNFSKAVQAVKDLTTALEALPSETDLDSEILQYSNIVSLWARKVKLENSVASRLEAIKKLEQDKTEHDAKTQELTDELLALHDAIDQIEPSAEEALKVEALWIKYDSYLQQQQQAQKALNILEAEKLLNPEPQQPYDYLTDLESVTLTLDSLKFKQRQHNQFISSINPEDESASCPTCGTPASNLKDKWLEAKEELLALSDSITALTEQIASTAAFDKKKVLHLAWKTNFVKRLETANKTLADLVEVAQPSVSRDEAKGILEKKKILKDSFVATGNKINALDVLGGRLGTSLDHQTAEMQKELDELKGYSDLDETSVNSANTVISELKITKSRIQKLKTDIALSEAEVKNCNQKIEAARNQLSLAALHDSWNERIDNLKKVFKYNALPMVLSYKYMAKVVTELNNTLAQIGVPFNIELEQDLSFTANFGSKKVPAARLSGGQKVILTIAYRLAVNSTFAANLGLLCLDEPTVGLDEANLGALEKAFDRLKQFSASNGVQILVVTHEKNIGHLFDHTIDLH